MKLRIRGDSLRLRLTRGEVAALAAEGRVEETTSFGGGAVLRYAITLGDVLGAKLDGSKIEVTVARETAERWARSDEVGIEGAQDALRILIEKDWSCLKPRDGEDDADAFPHPRG